jgi:hypothetical protein
MPLWITVPAMLGPLYLLIHLTIAAKLRSLQRTSQPLTTAAGVKLWIWSGPLEPDRSQAADLTVGRVCCSSKLTGLR